MLKNKTFLLNQLSFIIAGWPGFGNSHFNKKILTLIGRLCIKAKKGSLKNFLTKNLAGLETFLVSILRASLIDTSSLRGFRLAEPWSLLKASPRRNRGTPLKIISCLQVAYNLISECLEPLALWQSDFTSCIPLNLIRIAHG